MAQKTYHGKPYLDPLCAVHPALLMTEANESDLKALTKCRYLAKLEMDWVPAVISSLAWDLFKISVVAEIAALTNRTFPLPGSHRVLTQSHPSLPQTMV